jgi:hypothetical protein
MKNTADVTRGKPIAVLLQSISGVSAINPLVAFYDIHGGKREVLFFYFVPDTTRDIIIIRASQKQMRKSPHFIRKSRARVADLRTQSVCSRIICSHFKVGCILWHKTQFKMAVLRISKKYGSPTRNKFLIKSVTLWNNMTYIQNTHRFRGFKLTFADWF